MNTTTKIRTEFTHNDTVARIILDDGKANIIDHVMMDELQKNLSSFEGMSRLKLITFEGAGGNFSFGASVNEHTKEKATKMLRSFHGLFHTNAILSIPTLAKVSGQCLGGGMELTLMCNFIFADMGAKFAQPEIKLGVFPPPASVILPLKIGAAKAEDLIITGRSIKAEEALEIGLINTVFPDYESMQGGTERWIEKYISSKSASSLRYAVSASRTMFNKTLIKQLRILETLYLDELMETADANEGIASFLEKREPVWKDH